MAFDPRNLQSGTRIVEPNGAPNALLLEEWKRLVDKIAELETRLAALEP